MKAFRNVVFWFVGLLVITVVGFWRSYFGIFFQGHPFSHHFHGKVRTPFLVLAGLWGLNLVLWHLLPAWEGWRAFTVWSAEIVS